VLVVATDGDHGETPADLAVGESLADRRRRETEASAAELGIARIAWLGYRDSGMTGWEQNGHPDSFLRADLDESARRLAAILREESADVLTIYDWHGNYGHPDHIQVHRVGSAAAELVDGVRVLEATFNRDAFDEFLAVAREHGIGIDGMEGEADFDPHAPADDGNPMGTPEAELTLAVDVRAHVAAKRRALQCHRSQVTDTSLFAEMPDEVFELAFGREWFIERDARPPMRTGWLFA
jgi:LmbE family N-acetylglucosaminyl deacetylase